jgi:hypothetical protein
MPTEMAKTNLNSIVYLIKCFIRTDVANLFYLRAKMWIIIPQRAKVFIKILYGLENY